VLKLVTLYMYDHVTTRLIYLTLVFKLFVITVLFLTDTSLRLYEKKTRRVI